LALQHFYLSIHDDRRYLHSFPTRRSSDLSSHVTQGPALTDPHQPRLEEQPRAQGLEHRIDEGAVDPRERGGALERAAGSRRDRPDRKSTRLNSSHVKISYAVFCLKKKKTK